MKPPWPDCAPPWALSVPPTSVRPSDHTAIWPPLPAPSASARMLTPSFSVVRVALGCGPAPWKLPPTSTCPPPASPEACTVAPLRRTVSPSSCTVPPVCPAPRPDASSVPATSTELPGPLPSSTMCPCSWPMVWAWITPLLFTALGSRLPAARALSTT